jgi:hypothetical protein
MDALFRNEINWKCVSMKFTFVCNCGKTEERNIYHKLKLGITISSRLGFSALMAASVTTTSYLRGDAEFDAPALCR